MTSSAVSVAARRGWKRSPGWKRSSRRSTRKSVEVHSLNFPHADHHLGDVTRFPRAVLFWASPSCPAWSDACGRGRDFATSTQDTLFDTDETPAERAERLARVSWLV